MDEMKRLSTEDFRNEGYLSEVNRQFFHPLGLAMAVDTDTGEIFILDDREDLDGWYMGDAILEEVTDKAALVRAEREHRDPIREASLGFVIQPVGED